MLVLPFEPDLWHMKGQEGKRIHEQHCGPGQFKVFEEYHQLSELLAYESQELGKEELAAIRIRLQTMVKKEPDYLDPYLLLCDVYTRESRYTQADRTLEKAYQRALALILDDHGRWPEEIPWLHLDNRPIVRTLLEKARHLWHAGAVDPESWRQAFALYENILRTNPNDNVGARYLVLAMLERMTPDQFDERFSRWNEYVGQVSNGQDEPWFRMNAPKHRELRWWLAYAKAQGWT